MVSPGGEEEIPDWLAGIRPGADETTQEYEPEEAALPTPDIGELLSPDSMPAWMQRQEGQADSGSAPAPAPGQKAPGQENLEQADLPRWLEAMRPIQAAAVSTEDDDRVESVGPLAGLRGVLSAEPVVAMPRRPAILAGNIDATQAQNSAADLLRRLMIEPEVRAARRQARSMAIMPFLRKGVAALLLLAVLLPAFGVGAVFSPPGALPAAGQTAGAVVESLPVDRPVLAAFEYDASSAPELETGATAILGHLAKRGIPVFVISTQPNGATLAEGLLKSSGTTGITMPAVHYNFGYIPGGASGLRGLAANLHGSLGLTETEWNTPPLSGIAGVGDFSMILVIAARPQTVRDWVEQVHTAAPGTPMVAIVSAAADALVYPYTQGSRPSIQGMVAGYAGAQAYGARFLQEAAAYSGMDMRWQAFGMGSLVSMIILVVGAVVSLIAGGLKKSRRNSE